MKLGFSLPAVAELEARGLTAYIQEQLSPETIDESGNAALSSRLDALFDVVVPAKDTPICRPRGSSTSESITMTASSRT